MKIPIESLPGGTLINLAAANEHVPDIKRKIRVVKEQCGSTYYGLPLQNISKLLTNHIVPNTMKILNFIPAKGGI